MEKEFTVAKVTPSKTGGHVITIEYTKNVVLFGTNYPSRERFAIKWPQGIQPPAVGVKQIIDVDKLIVTPRTNRTVLRDANGKEVLDDSGQQIITELTSRWLSGFGLDEGKAA